MVRRAPVVMVVMVAMSSPGTGVVYFVSAGSVACAGASSS
jgi:hypothetical protein